MGDAEYSDMVDRLIEQLEDELDEFDEDLDIDSAGGILNVELPDGSAIIISRQITSHEIWVAARSGGFHLAFIEEQVIEEQVIEEQWFCRTTDETLGALLSRVFSEQMGRPVELLSGG